MTPPPPRQTTYVLRSGQYGAAVYCLQKALGLTPDANFGPATEQAVKDYQAKTNLVRDGIAGGATQQRLVRSLAAPTNNDLPKGLAKALILGESGGWIGAVNWSVEGGCDIGYTQRRVYASHWNPPWPDYSSQFHAADLERAYDSHYQVGLLAKRVRERHDAFVTAPAVSNDERAWRLGIFSHNNPEGAKRLASTKEANLSSYWTTPQRWVIDIHAHFKDGTAVQTPLDWARFYSLGSPAHNHDGKMCEGVEW